MKAKSNFIAFLLIFLIVLALGMCVFLYKIFSSEGGECLSNPMGYYVEKLEKVNGEDMLCSCRLASEVLNGDIDFNNINIQTG